MTPRNVAAAELQELLESLQALAMNGERLAASTGLVDAKYFRAMQTMVSMLAGELDQKGLLTKKKAQQPAEESAPA